MPVSYNYTGRVDIDPSYLTADIAEVDGVFTVDLAWDLSDYGLPAGSVLQATFNGLFERQFESLGPIDLGVGTAKVNISTMRKPKEVTVSLKVVEKDSAGIPILIAFLDKKKPTIDGQDASNESILESLLDPELKVPWRVKFETGRPILHISNFDDMGVILQNRPIFDMLVIPSVLESILTWLVWDKSPNNEEEIVQRWRETFFGLGLAQDFFDKHTGDTDDLDSMDEVRAAGSECADEFSKRAKLLAATAKELEEK